MVVASSSTPVNQDKQEVIDLRGASDNEESSPHMKPRMKKPDESKAEKGPKRGPGRPPKMKAAQSGAKQDPTKKCHKRKETLRASSEETESEGAPKQQDAGKAAYKKGGMMKRKAMLKDSSEPNGKRAKVANGGGANEHLDVQGRGEVEARSGATEKNGPEDLQTPPKRGPGRPKGSKGSSKRNVAKGIPDNAGKVLRTSRAAAQREGVCQKLMPPLKGPSEDKMLEEADEAAKSGGEAACSGEQKDPKAGAEKQEDVNPGAQVPEGAVAEFSKEQPQAPERKDQKRSTQEAQAAATPGQAQEESEEELGQGKDAFETKRRDAEKLKVPEADNAAAEVADTEKQDHASGTSAEEQGEKREQACSEKEDSEASRVKGLETAVFKAESDGAKEEVPKPEGSEDPSDQEAVNKDRIAPSKEVAEQPHALGVDYASLLKEHAKNKEQFGVVRRAFEACLSAWTPNTNAEVRETAAGGGTDGQVHHEVNPELGIAAPAAQSEGKSLDTGSGENERKRPMEREEKDREKGKDGSEKEDRSDNNSKESAGQGDTDGKDKDPDRNGRYSDKESARSFNEQREGTTEDADNGEEEQAAGEGKSSGEERERMEEEDEEEEMDTPKTAAEKMTTRGKRVPVKRLWEEAEVLPQRQRQDKMSSKTKGGFMCDVCGVVFQNGQALGGHKGSHKGDDFYTEEEKRQNTSYGPRGAFQKATWANRIPSKPAAPPAEKTPVETRAGWACEICGVVFATGQALGGHKGVHKSMYQTKELPSKEGNDAGDEDNEENGKSFGKRVIKRPTPLIAEIGTAASKGMGRATGAARSKDRLQSLAAMLSKRSRQKASIEGEREREESSKRIVERLKRTAEKRAEEELALSPAGQKGKGMDSFEEDAVAGLMVLRQPIILAAERERHRRKRARIKSSQPKKSEDEGTLAAVKALVGKGLEEEYDPEKDSDRESNDEEAFSSGAEKSGSKERCDEERPRRPETRTKEERRVTRKLRDESDEEEVWRPRIRERNPDKKKQRLTPKVGLLSELVSGREKRRRSSEPSSMKSDPEKEKGSAPPADPLVCARREWESASVVRLFGKPLIGGFKVPSASRDVNVTKPLMVGKPGSPPLSIPVTEETEGLNMPGANSEEERELLPLSALKQKTSLKMSKKGEGKKGEERKRKRDGEGKAKRKRKRKGGKEGDESRSGSPTEEATASDLKRLPKLNGEGARGVFDVKKLASALKNGGKSVKKVLDSDEDAPIGLKMRSPEKKKPSASSEQEATRKRKKKEDLRRKLRAGILALPANGGSRVSDPGSITEANSASESEDVPIGRRYSEKGGQCEEDWQRAVQESVAMLQQFSGSQVDSASERKRLKKEARARKKMRKEAEEGCQQDEQPREKKSKRSRKEKGSHKTSPSESQEVPHSSKPAPSCHGHSSGAQWPHPSSQVNDFLEKLGLTTDFATGNSMWKRKSAEKAAADDLGAKSVGFKVPGYTVLTEEEASEDAPVRTQLQEERMDAALCALRSARASLTNGQRKDRLDLNVAGGLGLGSRGSSPAPGQVSERLPWEGSAPPELGAFYRDKGVVKNGKWLPMNRPQEKDLGREWSQNRCQPDLPAVKTGLSQFLKGFPELHGSPNHGLPAGALRASPHDPPSFPLDLNLSVTPTPPLPSTYGQLTDAIRIAASERDLLSRKWPPSWLPTSLEGRREMFTSGGAVERPYAPPRFDPRDQTGISGPPLFRGPQPDAWRAANSDRTWPTSLHPRGGAFEMQRGGSFEPQGGSRMSTGADRRASPGFLELRVMEAPKQDAPLFAEEEISEKRANLAYQTLLKNAPPPQSHLHRDHDLLKSAETLRRLLGKNEDMTSPAIRSFAEGVKNMLLEGSKLLPESEVHELPRPEMLSRSAGLAIPHRSTPAPVDPLHLEAEARKQSAETAARGKTSSVPGWLLPEIEKRRRSMQEGAS